MFVQVNDLREVVEHMRLLEERVKTAENLCQQTLLNCQTAESASDDTAPQALPVVHINPEAVSKCANDVVMLARALITDESRYFLAVSGFVLSIYGIVAVFMVSGPSMYGMCCRQSDCSAPIGNHACLIRIDHMMCDQPCISREHPHLCVQAQSFPVDESDLQSFLQRAAEAVGPLLNLLYQKAFSTYDSIFEPSIRNFDKRFRVQNAQRLLK